MLVHIPGRFILIQDGVKYHTSQETQTFFQEYRERLTVYQLPSYSPAKPQAA